MFQNKELEDRQSQEMYAFVREQHQSKRAYDALYNKYYKTGQQITNDQRAEVRKAFTDYDEKFGEEKEGEMERRHIKEREDYNAEAYQKWTKLEVKRGEFIKEYGSIANVPKEVMDKYKEERREYDFEWGENGNQKMQLLREQNAGLSEKEKQVYAKWEEVNISPYQKTIRKHMKEREAFNGKVADNWLQHEHYREDLVKEYNGWNNVPPYQKELFKQRKQNFELEWGEDGSQKQYMRKRHHEEIATQMKIETEKYRSPQKDKDRQREKE